MRRVCRQIVVDRLLVADVDHQRIEYGKLGVFERRHEKTALHHILKQSGCFQTYRLAAGVGSRYYEYALRGVELHVERNYLASLRAERLCQKRVARAAQHQSSFVRNDRPDSSVFRRPPRLSAQGVHSGEVVARTRYALYVDSQRCGGLRQYADYLAALGIFQLAQRVVELYHLHRLDIERASGGRLVVYESRELAFVGGRNRNHGASVADRYHGIGIDYAGALGRREHLLQPFRYLRLVVAQRAPYAHQLGRCRVAHFALLVHDRIDHRYDVGIRLYAAAHLPQTWIARFGAREDEADQFVDAFQREPESDDLCRIEERALDAYLIDYRVSVDELAAWSCAVHCQGLAHLVGKRQTSDYFVVRAGECLPSDRLSCGVYGA